MAQHAATVLAPLVEIVELMRLGRAQLGWSQIRTAAEAGVGRHVVQGAEGGWRMPRPDELRRLRAVLPVLRVGLELRYGNDDDATTAY